MKKRSTRNPIRKEATLKKVITKKISEKIKQPSVASPIPNSQFHVIVAGASAGGLNAVNELVAQFPANLNAAVFIVLHLAKTALGEILFERIKKNTRLNCSLAKENDPIKPGHIYIARPDAHLLVKDDKILIGNGPPENRFRPSIDVLFRSAAAHYAERTIGVILTGFLNDGTSGMWAIKQSGGHCIVQDPNEAEYPDMPLSVLETMDVDYCLPLKKMGKIISKLTEENELKTISPPDIVVAESRLSEKAATALDKVSQLGEKTEYSCPDCGGGLWKIVNGATKHYRCHIGHAYSEKDFELRQSENIEHTLWVSLRMMEERKIFFARLSSENQKKGLERLSAQYSDEAKHLAGHINTLKELLFEMTKTNALQTA